MTKTEDKKRRWVRIVCILAAALFLILSRTEVSAAGKLARGSDGQLYYTVKGEVQTGWKKIDGEKYYFKKKANETFPRGAAVTGLIKIQGARYYFSSAGKMVRCAWRTVDGNVYYFKKNGKAATGGCTVGETVYVFDGKGRLIRPSHASRRKVGSAIYYVDKKGRAATSQWIKIGKKLCYASSSGKLKCSTTYEGIQFDKNGYAKSGTAASLKLLTMKIVDRITTDKMSKSEKLRACWNYMVSRSRFSYAGIYPSDSDPEWVRTIAYSMLSGKKGNCYGFACAFAALASEVGYDPIVVVGRVSGSRDHARDGMTRHCWVRIDGLNYDPEGQYAGWYRGCYGRKNYSVRHSIKELIRFRD